MKPAKKPLSLVRPGGDPAAPIEFSSAAAEVGAANGTRLRILLLEDNAPHAELTEHVLRNAGLDFVMATVDTRDAYAAELKRRPPDLILSDYSLPGFDGGAALEIARQVLPDVPFIFVTGTLGEELAIDTLKQGATDYVLKIHLSRLVPAVKRALLEARERRQRQRAEEKLRQSHEQLRALTGYLQSVREEERTRIAREVHDELGQALTGLKLDLAWLAGKLENINRGIVAKIRAMSAAVDGSIQTVRRIATELRPGILDDLGLIAAIEWQTNEFQERTGIRSSLVIEVREATWDQEFTTVCFRIFQETLTNIIRHANATEVEIRLTENDGQLVMTVRDNGRGITEKDIFNTRSIGLIGMRERASQVGGEVFFFGIAGRGTTVTVRVPFPSGAPIKGFRS